MGVFNRLFSYEYINKEHLEGLDRYKVIPKKPLQNIAKNILISKIHFFKYSCIDNSPLSKYVMHPFWNTIVEFYPRWLAPNVLTFVGFMCLILQHILFSIYDYSFYGYCFDRQNCHDDEFLNLTDRQLDYQNNLNEFNHTMPANVCSCIPRWLFFMIAICQFLSHHLGQSFLK